jgi:hypothetical protein
MIRIIGIFLGLFTTEAIFAASFPLDSLPPYIRRLTETGQRAEWSLDGTKVMYLTKAGGEVFEIDIETKEQRPITLHFNRPEGHGYYRALYLANGDYLLTGGPKRHEAYLQIMDKSLDKPPKVFDIIVREGPAVSRTQLKIAWTKQQEKIWIADIVYDKGDPKIINKTLIIDNKNVIVDGVKYEDMIEPQNFRPPHETELIWAQYGNDDRGIFTSETFGFHLETGEIINYSRTPRQYDEPEGIFPDGSYTLIECDKHHPFGTGFLDIYRLKLDAKQPEWLRLTYFSNVKGFRATNPVVRDDGRFIAFQESIADSAPGAGEGIYILDLEQAGLLNPDNR